MPLCTLPRTASMRSYVAAGGQVNMILWRPPGEQFLTQHFLVQEPARQMLIPLTTPPPLTLSQRSSTWLIRYCPVCPARNRGVRNILQGRYRFSCLGPCYDCCCHTERTCVLQAGKDGRCLGSGFAERPLCPGEANIMLPCTRGAALLPYTYMLPCLEDDSCSTTPPAISPRLLDSTPSDAVHLSKRVLVYQSRSQHQVM